MKKYENLIHKIKPPSWARKKQSAFFSGFSGKIRKCCCDCIEELKGVPKLCKNSWLLAM